jgi:hypothetical protein
VLPYTPGPVTRRERVNRARCTCLAGTHDTRQLVTGHWLFVWPCMLVLMYVVAQDHQLAFGYLCRLVYHGSILFKCYVVRDANSALGLGFLDFKLQNQQALPARRAARPIRASYSHESHDHTMHANNGKSTPRLSFDQGSQRAMHRFAKMETPRRAAFGATRPVAERVDVRMASAQSHAPRYPRPPLRMHACSDLPTRFAARRKPEVLYCGKATRATVSGYVSTRHQVM